MNMREGKAAADMSEKSDKLNQLIKQMESQKMEMKLNKLKDDEF